MQKAKPSTATQAIDASMGEEEKNRNQKEGQKKVTGSGPPTQTIHARMGEEEKNINIKISIRLFKAD